MGKSKAICSIEGCGKRVNGHGYCHKHYFRWRKHGSPYVLSKTPAGEALRYMREIVIPYQNIESCLTWPYNINPKSGRAYITISRKKFYVSRLVCEAVHGPAPTTKYEAAHSCGNGHLGCVNPKHLSWKTPTENQADRLIHGTTNRGERQGRSKLTEANVREIRKLKGVMPYHTIGKMFGVSFTTISGVLNGYSWGWLD